MTFRKKGRKVSEPSHITISSGGSGPLSFKAAALAAICLSIALYLNSIPNEYAFDDVAVISQNKFVKDGIAGIPSILSTRYWDGYDESYEVGAYRPVSLVTFALESQFFPGNPHISHAVQALLYGLLVMMLMLLLRAAMPTASPLILLLATLVFAAHPLHTEVVANLKSRDELFSLLFAVMACFFLLRYAAQNEYTNLAVSLSAFFFSLLSKEGSLTFLAVFPLLLYFFSDMPRKKIAVTSAAFLMATIAFFILKYEITGAFLGGFKPTAYYNPILAASDLNERVATTLVVLGMFLLRLVIPWPLSYDYSYAQISVADFSEPLVYLSILFWGLVLLLAYRWTIQKRAAGFGLLYLICTISIVSSILVPNYNAYADRFLFTPSLALAFLISDGLVYLSRRMESPGKGFLKGIPLLPAAFLCIVIIVYSGISIYRNPDWKNDLSLFSADVLKSDRSAAAQQRYGTALVQEYLRQKEAGNTDETMLLKAEAALKKAIAIYPAYPTAYEYLAHIEDQRGNYPQALQFLEEGARLSPKEGTFDKEKAALLDKLGENSGSIEAYKNAIAREGRQADLLINLAAAHIRNNELEPAIELLNEVLEVEPANIIALQNLGMAYREKGEIKLARATFERVIAIDPSCAKCYSGLGAMAQDEQDIPSAIAYYKKAIGLESSPQALLKLAMLYDESGAYQEALRSYSEAIQLKPDYAIAYRNKGNTYFRIGNWDKAIEAYEAAIRIKPDYVNAYLALSLCYENKGNKEKAEFFRIEADRYK